MLEALILTGRLSEAESWLASRSGRAPDFNRARGIVTETAIGVLAP